jgi:hypothetical protein
VPDGASYGQDADASLPLPSFADTLFVFLSVEGPLAGILPDPNPHSPETDSSLRYAGL